MADYADWETEVRHWCLPYETIVHGVTIETYIRRIEDEPFITVMWMDGSDAGRCVALLHGEAEWLAWRDELFAVYGDPRWDEEHEPTLAVETWLDAEAHSAGEMTAAGWGDDWAGYCTIKARRMARKAKP